MIQVEKEKLLLFSWSQLINSIDSSVFIAYFHRERATISSFLGFLIDIQIIYHKIETFKVYNSILCSTFISCTTVATDYRSFRFYQRNPIPISSYSLFPPPSNSRKLLIYFQFLCIRLFQTFHTHKILKNHLCVWYFSLNVILKVYPSYYMKQHFIPSYSQIIFHCMHIQ